MALREAVEEFVRRTTGSKGEVEIVPLSARGSDRTFSRIRWDGHRSAILVEYDPARTENGYYGAITRFLAAIGVPVPVFFGEDKGLCLLILEDLGEMDLWSLREGPREVVHRLYLKTLRSLHRLHSFPLEELSRYDVTLMEGFGPSLYQWEREYFQDRFLKGMLSIDMEPSFAAALETELSGLASRLEATRQCLVHRDLQSQNVMVREGEIFLIDYQGMRAGSPFYDLASLLADPYMQFPEEEMAGLLRFYYELEETPYEWSGFEGLFWDACSQRLMQALGAYGFLSSVKGLGSFVAHIPAALTNLALAASRAGSLPLLAELAVSCEKRWRAVTSGNKGE